MNKYFLNKLLPFVLSATAFCEPQRQVEVDKQNELKLDPKGEIINEITNKDITIIMNKEEIECLKTFGYLMASNAGIPSLSLNDEQLNCIFEGFKSAVKFEQTKDNFKDIVSQMGDFFKSLENKSIEKNKTSEAEFLALKDKEKDVIKTKSGLRYKVIKQATSQTNNDKITVDSEVKVDYKGQLINGFIFDKNDDVTFYVGSLIPGFQEALQLMQVGETIEAYIPSELGYKSQVVGSIPPASCLIFTITLKGLVKAK
jgi:FKBP-type peptidyl-prolyl cis-trans isomerase